MSTVRSTSTKFDVEALFPALVHAPDAPALVEEDGRIWSWRAVADDVARRARDLDDQSVPATIVHEPSSSELVRALWAHRLCSRVPVLVHPREPAARRDLLAAPVVQGLARLSAGERRHLADVVFSSGTSGAPKAIAHDDENFAAGASSANARLPFRPGDRWLLSLPVAHVSGLGVLERARVGGGCVVVPAPGVPLVASLRTHAITHLSVVRAQLADLLANPRGRDALGRLRAVVVGGGPTPQRLLADALSAGAPLCQTWGMTETCAMVTLTPPGRPLLAGTNGAPATSTSGTPLPGREVRVDAEGLLGVRGPGLAAGFVHPDGVRPLPRDGDGYFVSRDRARITDDGEVIILGRADAVFISGGEKVAPEDVEGVLLAHEGVLDALVVPVPHARYGMRPVAFVRLRHDVDFAELPAWAGDRLASYAVPDAFLPWPDDVTGKPSRPRLAERAAQLLGVSGDSP